VKAQATISLWLNNDQPMYRAAKDVIQKNHDASLGLAGAAWGVRQLVEDVLFNSPTMYASLCVEANQVPDMNYFQEVREGVLFPSNLFSIDWPLIVRELNEDIDW